MKHSALILCISGIMSFSMQAQHTVNKEPMVNTYSIVAIDTLTGEMGVAVQSHWFSVGTVVTWGKAGVGVVATQSLVNTSFGPRGLALMNAGIPPEKAIEALTETDPGRDYRQVAMVDVHGNVSAYTGQKCIPDAGHIVGKTYSVQANMMINKKIWSAMAESFENSSGPLAERMLMALEAAENAGGDIRGKQSAAILVVKGMKTDEPWNERVVDLRVEDHAEPLKEIRRLLQVHRAYEHMNKGDLALEKGDTKAALHEYSSAEKILPDNVEMKFWHAVSLLNTKQYEAAYQILKDIFQKDKNYIELLNRLIPIELLNVPEDVLKKINDL